MKKLIYSATIALAALAAASCVQEHIEAVYDPANTTAQTLGSIEGRELSEDGDAITTTYNAADLGNGLAASYALYASESSTMESKTKISATISDGTISFAQKEINTLILNLGGEAGTSFPLSFALYSYLTSDKGTAIESTAICSNIVSATFIPYNAELRDSDKYPVVYLPGGYQVDGSVGSGWVFTDEQYLFDYAGDGVYKGLVDFYTVGGGGLNYGFKLTYEPTWDNGDMGDAEGSPTESEPSVMTVHSKNVDGDDNILCFDTHRYYFFEFDSNAMTLSKTYAFDNIGIVGAFNDWNQADENMKMAYNKYYHRFYIDQTFADATELKFTCDDAWDMNWGENFEPGGANIAVEAGSYRIYFDFNKKNIEFSTKMFGQTEPGGGDNPEPDPDPVTYEGWGIIGDFNSWDGDVAMTEVDGVWTGYVNLSAADGWKLRKDAGWDENRGGTFVTYGEPFAVSLNGDNITIGADGFFKVVYDSNAETVTVTEGDVWSLIGVGGDWDTDIDMVLTDGLWVSPATQISGEFKLRYNHGWTANRGGTMAELGTAFAAVADGDNINVSDGLYKVTYDPANETILVEAGKPENQWSIIGAVLGSNWDTDFYMTKQSDGTWLYEGLEIAEGDQFKIRYNNDWGVNRGATGDTEPYEMVVGTAVEVVNNGKNLTGPAGTYDLVYNPDEETMTLAAQDKGWGVCGNYNGWGATPDVQLVETFPGIFISEPIELTAGWKIRYNNDWDVNFGGATPSQQGEFVQAVADGADISLEGTYKVVYNANNGTLGTLGWGVTGSIASAGVSWDIDIPMNLTSDGTWVSAPVALTTSDQFKIRWNADWNDNRGATGDTEPYVVTVDTPIGAANGGKNLSVPADGTYVIVYNPAEEQMSISSSVVGLIGDFNSWGGDEFMFYAGEGKFYAYNRHYEGGWKIRFNAGWDANRGASGDVEPYALTLDTSETLVQNGKNLCITDSDAISAGYNICFDAANDSIVVSK